MNHVICCQKRFVFFFVILFWRLACSTLIFSEIDGRREDVAFDKITARINKLCYNLNRNFVDSAGIAQKVLFLVYTTKTIFFRYH